MESEIPTTSPLPIESISHCAATDIGRRREENQDSFGVIEGEKFRFLLVADGMGGVKGGAVASGLTVQLFEERLRTADGLDEALLTESVRDANAAIYERGNEDAGLAGMGTTLVALGFIDDILWVVNVGDSRAYLVRNGRILQLTKDHTLVRELVSSGAITEDQAENHPVAHMLTRSLGPSDSIEPDCRKFEYPLLRGDRFLLCSDGLYNLVNEAEIATLLTEQTLQEAQEELIRLANERGGTDNITVIVAELGEGYPAPTGDEEPLGRLVVSEGALDDTIELTSEDLSDSAEEGEVSSASNGTSPSLEGQINVTNTLSGYLSRKEAERIESLDSSVEESDETKQQPTPSPLRLRSSWSQIFGVFLLGALTVVLVGKFRPHLFSSEVRSVRVGDPSEVSKPITPPFDPFREVSKPAKEAVGEESANEGSVNASADAANKEQTAASENQDSTGDHYSAEDHIPTSTFGGANRPRLAERRDELRQQLRQISHQIEAFERPISGSIGEVLENSRSQRKKLEQALEDTRTELDLATRRLAVWYGRKRRLQDTDPINLATEVAISSPSVRKNKEAFEKTTWAYLEAVEASRYNPNDVKLRVRVQKFAQERKQDIGELVRDVRKVIDDEISASDKSITDLTLKRDKIEAEIVSLREELDYVRTLMEADPKSREEKKRQLESQREALRQELKETESLLTALDGR